MHGQQNIKMSVLLLQIYCVVLPFLFLVFFCMWYICFAIRFVESHLFLVTVFSQ